MHYLSEKSNIKRWLEAHPPKKTRISRGTTNRVLHKRLSKSDRNFIVWAMNLKPGDLINSYDCFNHVVERIKVCWTYAHYYRTQEESRKPRGEFVKDVIIYTTDGWQHGVSEWDCVTPPWSPEQIRKRMGDSVVDKMIELGIISKDCTRFRSATDEEKKLVNALSMFYVA